MQLNGDLFHIYLAPQLCKLTLMLLIGLLLMRELLPG